MLSYRLGYRQGPAGLPGTDSQAVSSVSSAGGSSTRTLPSSPEVIASKEPQRSGLVPQSGLHCLCQGHTNNIVHFSTTVQWNEYFGPILSQPKTVIALACSPLPTPIAKETKAGSVLEMYMPNVCYNRDDEQLQR